MGIVAFAKRRPKTLGTVAVAGVGLLVFVLIWFQPQKLVLNDLVAEPEPTVAATTSARQILSSGRFGSRAHHGEGSATVLQLATDRRVLRLTDFEVENGPDLFVYLSTAPPDAAGRAFDDDFVSLGRLKGNVGDQNYTIPAGVDLSTHSTVAIWCRRFRVVFATAALRA